MNPPDNNAHGFSLMVIVIAAISLVLLGVLGYVAFRVMNASRAPTGTSQSDDASRTPATDKKSEENGTITGKTSYPGSQLPADGKVCADRTDGTDDAICTDVGKDQQKTFSLAVPAGEYYVYATAETEMPGHKAYYAHFTACADPQDTTCEDEARNDKIPVSVSAGEIISLIAPSGWNTAE